MTAYVASKGLVEADKPETFAERWLLVPKTLYFLLNMFVYGFHGLMGIFFLKQWHFTYYQYGYASSVIASNFFGAMIWSSLADRTGRYKTIITVTSVLYTIVALMLLVPVFNDSPGLKTFYVFFMLALFNFFLAASFPLLDAQIMGMLASNPKISKDQFGNQRMFGAFGHLLATFGSLMLYEHAAVIFSALPTTIITYQAWAQGILQVFISIVFIGAIYVLVPDVKPVKGGHHGHHAVEKKVGDSNTPVIAPNNPVRTLMLSPNFMFFMLFIAFSGIVRSISTNFQKPISHFIMKGNMSHTASLDIGRAFSEVFVYATAKYLRSWMGVYWVLVFSQLTGILRLWGYGVMDTSSSYAYVICFGLELLKGFNSGLISSSAIMIASNLAPAGCESTAQGLYSGMYSGLSMAFGGLVGGAILQYLASVSPAAGVDKHLKEVLDAQTMFQWISYATLLITILLTAKYIFVDRVMGMPGFPRRRSAPLA